MPKSNCGCSCCDDAQIGCNCHVHPTDKQCDCEFCRQALKDRVELAASGAPAK